MNSVGTGLRSDLRLSHLSVRPGQSASVDVEVTNTGEVIDGISAIVDGINPDWISLDQPMVSLFPESSTAFKLTFNIPLSCPAGDYLIVVRMVSTIDPERQTAHDFWLTVDAVPALALELRPRIVTGGKHAQISAIVNNIGNCEAEVRVTAVEPTREVDCKLEPAAVVVASNDVALVDVDVTGPRPWFGQITQRTIILTAIADDVAVEQLATFNQKPRIARGVITALTLALIIVLWALIFLWAISTFTNNDDSTKAVGTALLTGVDDIPLANIAATASGTVTASTTGEGLPRLTVTAERLGRDDVAIPTESVTTDEDGAFILQSLLPGTYRFRISGDGFAEVWYPMSPTPDGAEQVRLEPVQPRQGLDLVLAGEPGSLTGKISLPPDAGDLALTVSALQLVEQTAAAPTVEPDASDPGTAPSSPAPATPEPITQETTDGTIDIGGLATPATYLVTVSGPGFETQQFEQRVAPGADTILNTVGLDAAEGSITGTVTDGGEPLGEVVVTARSGDSEVAVITPTIGNAGQYEIIGLATPQTWVLTFERPGYTSQTLALDLTAGQTQDNIDVALVGGSGTVSGAAVASTGVPLGGVDVRIDGDKFRAETSTLTSGSVTAGPGTFSVADLPVPGTYTITLSIPGLQTETVAVTFDAAGERSVGNVEMVAATAVVRGTVLVGGVGRGGVTVSLTDGITMMGAVIEQTTISATNPAGVFSFVNVEPGTYTLTFVDPELQTRVILVRVVGGVDLDLPVVLTEVPS